MLELTLIRHANAQTNSVSGNDIDRTLSAKGRADTARVGQRLGDCDRHFDLILSSSAPRALETAAIMALATGHSDEAITAVDSLYCADVDTLLNSVNNLSPAIQSAALIAHNPGLAEFCGWLCGQDKTHMPTCSVATIRLDVEDWMAVGPGSGQLTDFDYPAK